MADLPRVALIQFPGSTCENETRLAAQAAGLDCEVFRWNLNPAALQDFEGYIIGGGFSFQDRVRAGAIAAKQPLMRTLFREVTEQGKPCLGIGNGAQILVETGLLPGLAPGQVQMGLAPNSYDVSQRIAGFCCRWVYLKHACAQGRCALTSEMPAGAVIPLPIAHGEGRFVTCDPEVLAQLQANDQIVWQYCDAAGQLEADEGEAINPNGSLAQIAGLCNPAGNVLGLMPHPQRAGFLRQIPADTGGQWGEQRQAAWGDQAAMLQAGPGLAVFQSLARSLGSPAAV